MLRQSLVKVARSRSLDCMISQLMAHRLRSCRMHLDHNLAVHCHKVHCRVCTFWSSTKIYLKSPLLRISGQYSILPNFFLRLNQAETHGICKETNRWQPLNLITREPHVTRCRLKCTMPTGLLHNQRAGLPCKTKQENVATRSPSLPEPPASAFMEMGRHLILSSRLTCCSTCITKLASSKHFP